MAEKKVQLAVNVIEIHGKKMLHVICRDITQYKQSEAKLKKMIDELSYSNRELEQFAYVASHDLQEPLRMVASFAQLLSKRYSGQLDSDADEFIDYIVDGATRMQSLINALLEFSRVGTRGKEFAPTDMQAVVEEVIKNLKISVQETKAQITYGELPKIMADTSQLIQLFQNLVANAIKFHGDAPPKIHIEAYCQDKQWVISICDNGIGIEEEHLDRVFQIFQRLHKRDQYDGTGIGLAICKKIVERHGGQIWVDSAPKIGSTFYFSITDEG
ncbi:MAG: GHKL domain-containing protein [Firmicutes bacterium]|nr:GHKL domain-containing protein [Bacillota bacterium]